MKLPIRNYTGKPLRLFIEVLCSEYEIPPGGEAIVHLKDGHPHSIDMHEGQVTVWNEGPELDDIEIHATMLSIQSAAVSTGAGYLPEEIERGEHLAWHMPKSGCLISLAAIAIAIILIWRAA